MPSQNIQLLELHFAQLARVWNKSKYNNYSDPRKKEYHENLERIYSQLLGEDFKKLNVSQLNSRTETINFLFKSLEFLDSSTLNYIPFEIIQCLELVLKDWIITNDKFIIVTSLVNNINNFSFEPNLVINNSIYDLIEKEFKITFNAKLIQINLPKYLTKDYLANVVIYHELGHFIDRYYKITEALADDIIKQIVSKTLKPDEIKSLKEYFPFLGDPALPLPQQIRILYSHLGEYFSDIFASQYIDVCSTYYLEYITQNSILTTPTHPSTVNRNKIVNIFLNDVKNEYVLNKLKDATNKISKLQLEKRYDVIISDDFINLLPVEIKTEKQLHYLFVLGWQIWLKQIDDIVKHNNIQFSISNDKIYDIINNLIEKSIANYIIQESWDKFKP